MLILLLFLCLFALGYFLLCKDAGDGVDGLRGWCRRFSLPIIAAGAAFLMGTFLCRTPLGGLVWAIGGWFVPGWVAAIITGRKKSATRALVMSFAATAAGLYAAGQVTPDVIRIAAARFPEPLAGEFQVMIGKRNTDKKASFPAMFESLAVRYGLPEFNAIALIVAASERAGGPHAASEGLKHLAAAMRARDRRLGERRKETLQPLIAAGMVMIIIALGFLLDVTMLSSLYFSTPSGKFMLTITSLLILIMLLMVMKALDPKDLLGGV